MDLFLIILGCIGLGMAVQSLGGHDPGRERRDREKREAREEWDAYFRGEYDLDDDSGE